MSEGEEKISQQILEKLVRNYWTGAEIDETEHQKITYETINYFENFVIYGKHQLEKMRLSKQLKLIKPDDFDKWRSEWKTKAQAWLDQISVQLLKDRGEEIFLLKVCPGLLLEICREKWIVYYEHKTTPDYGDNSLEKLKFFYTALPLAYQIPFNLWVQLVFCFLDIFDCVTTITDLKLEPADELTLGNVWHTGWTDFHPVLFEVAKDGQREKFLDSWIDVKYQTSLVKAHSIQEFRQTIITRISLYTFFLGLTRARYPSETISMWRHFLNEAKFYLYSLGYHISLKTSKYSLDCDFDSSLWLSDGFGKQPLTAEEIKKNARSLPFFLNAQPFEQTIHIIRWLFLTMIELRAYFNAKENLVGEMDVLAATTLGKHTSEQEKIEKFIYTLLPCPKEIVNIIVTYFPPLVPPPLDKFFSSIKHSS